MAATAAISKPRLRPFGQTCLPWWRSPATRAFASIVRSIWASPSSQAELAKIRASRRRLAQGFPVWVGNRTIRSDLYYQDLSNTRWSRCTDRARNRCPDPPWSTREYWRSAVAGRSEAGGRARNDYSTDMERWRKMMPLTWAAPQDAWQDRCKALPCVSRIADGSLTCAEWTSDVCGPPPPPIDRE